MNNLEQVPFEALRASDSGLAFYGADEPTCPHCGKENDISESGAYRLYADGDHQLTCAHCNLDFTVITRVSYSFSTDEQDGYVE